MTDWTVSLLFRRDIAELGCSVTRRGSAMTELERCIAFLSEIDARAAEVASCPFRFGSAFLHAESPASGAVTTSRRPRTDEDASAELLAAEADRVLGEAGIAHRKVEVCDEEVGARLAPEFRGARLAGRVRRGHGRPAAPDREADSSVEEVRPEELEPVWAEAHARRPDVDGRGVIRQLADGKRRRRIGDRVPRSSPHAPTARSARYCELYSDDSTGQIENVLTLEQFRNRGLARALVSARPRSITRAGNDLTFLLANRDDWPKELYRKLGFDEIGGVYDFRRSLRPSSDRRVRSSSPAAAAV